ncbi:hypothetical protein JG687_00013835 [Phytophthora cactorum]|uniref:Uncharacterized protein n=1 Tax=Phytophthora cactorum TaxID=29920 RepID=A0A8T1TY58_9STRA|nr:hypothetical protein JG687_00013835 [Phytophthora cactorum]
MTLCHRISRGIHDAACSFTKAAKTNRTAQNNSTTFDGLTVQPRGRSTTRSL